MKMRPAWQIIIDALESGMKVTMDEQKWVMRDTEDGRKVVVVELTEMKSGEPHYVDPEIPLNAFVALCERYPKQELAALTANVAFIRWQRSRIQQRS